MKIILLGPPGSGKGTQASITKEKYNIPHISTGDIFRYNIKNQTELGKLAASYINVGKLVPDEVTINMVNDRIHQEDCKNGFLLDGFPRNIEQAKEYEQILHQQELVIHEQPVFEQSQYYSANTSNSIELDTYIAKNKDYIKLVLVWLVVECAKIVAKL